MAAMQCIYDQAARPLVNVTRDQILNINRDHIQSKHALQNVTRDQVLNVKLDHIQSEHAKHALQNVT